ncbi:MAG: class I SAM-dependent methyltransferase [Dehalococcoidales bacterium]|nr:class I SAM-dependent methyltransferase [Dehalococcoidales bacterium]
MSKYGGYEDREFVAEFYDAIYADLHRKDIEFFIDYARRLGRKTLEVGCGTGRVLVPAALAGCEITGLDISPYMLKKCREKVARLPREVRRNVYLLQGDMTNFTTSEEYNLVTIPFRPFQHLITVDEQKACLGCIHKHLDKKGILVFDVYHPFLPRLIDSKYSMEMEVNPPLKLPDGSVIRRTNRTAAFHRAEQYNDIELIFYVKHPDGREERLVQAFPMRYFYRYEVEHLLSLCGFRVVELFGNFDRSAFSDDSPEMIFVAEKTG